MTTPLAHEIADMIAADGPMTLARYMELCLGHPRHGYYMTRDPLGARGDFVTAPEISQMFGELIGVWCVQAWQTMGAPSPVRLVELGPGRGTLMADLVRAAAIIPVFHAALDVHLVETSPVLRRAQEEALAGTGIAATWHEALEAVPDGPALIVANEFFDALPVRQLVFRDGAWRERVVGLDAEGRLAFGLVSREPPEDAPTSPAEEGAVLEVSPARRAVAAEIGRRITGAGGAAVIVDYGHAETGFGDTIQAVRGHDYVPLLDSPGESDLTAHVDFADLAAALTGAGAAAYGPVPQGDFLESLGLTARAEALKEGAAPGDRAELDAAVERLAGRGESAMGALFKALVAADPRLPPPYPFTSASA